MKRTPKIIIVAMLLCSLVFFFLPIASFEDNTAASMQADIEKQEGRVQSAQDQLQRWIDGGKKSEADIEKQRAKVQKEQDKLDALVAEMENAAAAGDGLSYSLLPGKLPAELELDETVINSYKTYPADGDFDTYYVLIWTAAGLILLSALLILLGGNKLRSKFYTFGGFANLFGLALIVIVLLKLQAFPIKLPYGAATIKWGVALPLILLPLIAFAMQTICVQNTKRSMIYVFCTFLSVLALLPFWVMIVNATRSSAAIQASVSLIPSTFLAHNWQVLTGKNFNIMTGFVNSAIIAVGSTVLSVYFSALTAYGFKVYRFKGNKFLWAVVMAIIMIPGQVTGTGFYMFMYKLKLTNNFIPLIIPSIASASTVFFFRQYLEANFQISLVEASRIDGAGEFFTFNRIVLPIMVPAMATMGIMAVISSWNNYLTPLMLLSDPTMKTLPMMVKELRGDIYRTEYGSIYLGLTLTALPLIIVYFACSKYIIAGVALGGVKE